MSEYNKIKLFPGYVIVKRESVDVFMSNIEKYLIINSSSKKVKVGDNIVLLEKGKGLGDNHFLISEDQIFGVYE